MADASVESYSAAAFSLLKANLGFYSSEIPADLEDYLASLLSYSFRKLTGCGIRLNPGDLYDDQLQVMYAAWMYRKGGEGQAKPPMLQQAIRDRQVEDALLLAEEETV